MEEIIKAPFVTQENSCESAKRLLVEYGMIDDTPVNVERLAEKMGIDIVPISGLKSDFHIDGFLSRDTKTINTDLRTWEMNPRRHRFTVAHELGHLIHHASIYHAANYTDFEGYLEFLNGISPEDLSWLETHANNFAGYLLVPTKTIVSTLEQYFEKHGNKFSEQAKRAAAAGLTADVVVEHVTKLLAEKLTQTFDVNDQVIEIRLKRENLLKSRLEIAP